MRLSSALVRLSLWRRSAIASARFRSCLRAALLGLIASTICVGVAACGGGGTAPGAGEATTGKAEPASSSSLTNTPYQGGGTPTAGGVLTVARALPPTDLLPWASPTTGNVPIEIQIYDGLINGTPSPSVFEPALAESWTISKNGLTYDFHLRAGAKFSNGQPVRPQDVKFSLEHAANPKLSPGAILLVAIKTIAVTGPHEVQITLKQATPAFLGYLTTASTRIVPERAVLSLGEKKFGQQPVGTGPFMVTQFTPGSPEVVLKRNPYYWKQHRPYLAGVTFKYIQDDSARTLAAQSGSVDVAENVPFQQLSQVESAPGVALVKQHLFSTDWIMINEARKPLNEKAVRQALVYATPLSAISQDVFHGVAPPAATANLPTKYLDPSLKPYPYDPAKAQSLLKSAHVTKLSINMIITGGDAVGSQVGTILQSSWAKAGIRLTVQQKDFSSQTADCENQNYELCMFTPTTQVSDIPLDDEFDLFIISDEPKVFPWIGWHNNEAISLIHTATTNSNEAVRRRDFYKYQQILWEEQPIIGLVEVPNLFAVSKNVHNFVATGTGWPLLGEAWLAK